MMDYHHLVPNQATIFGKFLALVIVELTTFLLAIVLYPFWEHETTNGLAICPR